MTVNLEIPDDLAFGYVVDRVLLAAGDGDDTDDYPDVVPAKGSITFTPTNPNVLVHGGDATIAKQAVSCSVGGDGSLVGPSGKNGVWLVVGQYRVRYNLTGASINEATIEVREEHTPEDPLILTRWVEIKPTPTMKLVVNEELYLRTVAVAEEVHAAAEGLAERIESEVIRITSEGDYQGPSAYEVAVATGFDGTEAEWLASLRGPEGAASTVPGPRGAPGAVPTAADYAIVGPGRPDVPATTGGLVSDSTPVGATYTSTDGAGVGAFVWRKRPDSTWVVVDGDTGWRNVVVITESEGSCTVALRRVNDKSIWRFQFDGMITRSVREGITGLQGFRLDGRSHDHATFSQILTANAGNGQGADFGHVTVLCHSNQGYFLPGYTLTKDLGRRATAFVEIPVLDTWPYALPTN